MNEVGNWIDEAVTVIYSKKMANMLLELGEAMVRIDKSKTHNDRLVFIFKTTKQITKVLNNFSR